MSVKPKAGPLSPIGVDFLRKPTIGVARQFGGLRLRLSAPCKSTEYESDDHQDMRPLSTTKVSGQTIKINLPGGKNRRREEKVEVVCPNPGDTPFFCFFVGRCCVVSGGFRDCAGKRGLEVISRFKRFLNRQDWIALWWRFGVVHSCAVN